MKRILAAAALAVPTIALGQEAMYTQAVTIPSPDSLILREQMHVFRYGEHPIARTQETTIYELKTTLAYGLERGLALYLDVPVMLKEEKPFGTQDTQWDRGVSDLEVMLKWRVLKQDTGGVDTLRGALLGGASILSGDDEDFSSESINPKLGGVITKVWGRHGFNQDLIYTINTGGTRAANDGGDGPSDSLAFNTSYVYRVFPARYTADSTGAYYATIELNGLYETNGDVEIRWAPGFMYEGRRFGWEVMAQLPFYEELDERAELDWGVGVGVRLLF